MRVAPILIGLAALSFAHTAAAESVLYPVSGQVTEVSYSPAFQTALTENLGEREGDVLRERAITAVDRAITRRGRHSGDVLIEVVIVEARPNRPTMQQLGRRAGLDAMRSMSAGGAELRAVLRDGEGAVLSEVSHRDFSYTLDDNFFAPGQWTDANRAIRRFAEKVADAYVAQSNAR